MANMDLADRLIATLRIRAPAVATQALNLELFNTIDEFFKSTSGWRWESVVPLDAGLRQYPIFPPAGTDLVQVMGVEHKGYPVNPIPNSGDVGGSVSLRGRIVGDAPMPDYDATFEPNVINSPGGVFQYSIYFPTYITIDVPPSDDAAAFPLNLLLALTLDAEVLEDDPNEWPLEQWMWGSFHEAWLDGTLGRLMSQVAKPYSNVAMAQYHMKRFRKFIGRAKQTAARGYQFNTPNWRFPRWA
jgi:hypothetical protein